jgi:hypothetical protein
MVVKEFRFRLFFQSVPALPRLARAVCLLWFVVLAALATPAHAQSGAAKLQGHPLFWSDGIVRIADLDAYKATGFNLVVVRLSWTPSQTGEFSLADLAPQRAFAQAAAQRGLMVVYSLPAAPSGFENTLRISADSPSYLTLWTAWVNNAITNLNNTPNLLGWMLPDDPRSLPIFDDIGFQHWIPRNYATTAVLNTQWGASFTDFADVSISDVETLAKQWQANKRDVSADDSEQKRLLAAKSAVDLNLPFHPAALALAAYKWESYRDLLKAWASELREVDGGRHLVFSGRLPDYAQLLSQPEGVDVVLPNIVPGVTESDFATHNPQAIDIARRGGKFGALPMFTVRETALLPLSALNDLVGRWVSTARARGAVGACFDSWDNLKRNAGLQSTLAEKLSFLSRGRELQSWGSPPTCTTAVLLAPLADGITVKVGDVSNQVSRGLYGFGDNLVQGEPSTLVWSLRWGTAFGGVDYLSPDDLDQSLENRYSTIMAPQLLSCPNEVGTALSNFVFNGGTLMADLGLGALQSGGRASAMPPQMVRLFGVPGVYEVNRASFNLTGVATHPMFQAWNPVISRYDNTVLTLGEMPGSKAFTGSVGYSAAMPVAQTLAQGTQITQNFGATKRVLRAPVTINDAGRGYAIFAPFQMWAYWRPGNVGFDGFHGDLWARGASLALATSSLVPSPALSIEGQTLFPEVDNRGSSITLTNHDAPGQQNKHASLQTTGTGDWLWSNAIVLLSNDWQSLLSSGRPAPIENPLEFEARPRPLALYTMLQAGESKSVQMIPIAVQNLSGGPLCAEVVKATSSEVEFNVWPNAGTINSTDVAWQPTLGGSATCRVTMHSMGDSYLMVPGSRHRVVITDYAKPIKKGFQKTEQILAADEKGRLLFEFAGSACRIRITSASEPLVAADAPLSPPIAEPTPTPTKK